MMVTACASRTCACEMLCHNGMIDRCHHRFSRSVSRLYERASMPVNAHLYRTTAPRNYLCETRPDSGDSTSILRKASRIAHIIAYWQRIHLCGTAALRTILQRRCDQSRPIDSKQVKHQAYVFGWLERVVEDGVFLCRLPFKVYDVAVGSPLTSLPAVRPPLHLVSRRSGNAH